MFLVHECWDFSYTMKSVVRCFLMYCVFFIHRIQLIFLLHKPVVFILITVNETCSNHVLYNFFVLFILSIYPLGISTGCFHGYSELFNKKVINTCWFSNEPSSSTLIYLHGWFSFFNVGRNNQMITTGDCLDSVGNIHIIIVFAYTTVLIGAKTLTEVT